MQFEIIPAYDLPVSEQAHLFNTAFAGYLAGSVELDPPSFAKFAMLQGADLFYSRFVRVNGELAGFGYITRTFNVSRLSAMGVIPAHRRSGAGSHLLERMMEEAIARRDEAMVLEVFEQNEAAYSLYQRHGFEVVYRLFGWKRPPGRTDTEDDKVSQVPLPDALHTVSTPDFPAIPWQISRHAMAKLPAARAYRIGSVIVVVGDIDAKPLQIRGIFELSSVAPEQLIAAVGGVLNNLADRDFLVPAIFPERFDDLFAALGFTREKLNQFLMRRRLR